jgi:hypothetical protein
MKISLWFLRVGEGSVRPGSGAFDLRNPGQRKRQLGHAETEHAIPAFRQEAPHERKPICVGPRLAERVGLGSFCRRKLDPRSQKETLGTQDSLRLLDHLVCERCFSLRVELAVFVAGDDEFAE